MNHDSHNWVFRRPLFTAPLFIGALIVSGILVLSSLLLMIIRPFNLSIDFTGGVLLEVGYPQAANLEEIRADKK